MAVREVRLFGDPVLVSRADEVVDFDESLSTLIDDMFDTMEDAGGVGLAANQVGVLRRVFVFDTSHQEGGLRGHVINRCGSLSLRTPRLAKRAVCPSLMSRLRPPAMKRFGCLARTATAIQWGLWPMDCWPGASNTKLITLMACCF